MLRIIFSGLVAAALIFPTLSGAAEMSSDEILQRLQAQRADLKKQGKTRQARTRTLSIVDDAAAPAPQAAATQAPAATVARAQPSPQDTVVVIPAQKETPAMLVSAEPGVAASAPPPQALDAAVTIDLQILFEFDSARLQHRARGQVAKLCKALGADRGEGVYQVIGHTDSSGSFDYNLTLSRARAAEVIRYLTGPECGMPKRRFIAVGMGEQRLKLPESPRSAANRRVEIQIAG